MGEEEKREAARRIVVAHGRGFITDAEVAIGLADLLGLDIRCQMGECTHV